MSYSVGQGMGLYGSWALLALTHHFLVRLAAKRAGVPSRDSYAILGDDIVIAGKELAESYKTLIASLGINITMRKSVVPGRTPSGKVYLGCEFASRLYTPEGEVSPYSVSIFTKGTPLEIMKNFLDGYLRLEAGNIRRFP